MGLPVKSVKVYDALAWNLDVTVTKWQRSEGNFAYSFSKTLLVIFAIVVAVVGSRKIDPLWLGKTGYSKGL